MIFYEVVHDWQKKHTHKKPWQKTHTKKPPKRVLEGKTHKTNTLRLRILYQVYYLFIFRIRVLINVNYFIILFEIYF